MPKKFAYHYKELIFRPTQFFADLKKGEINEDSGRYAFVGSIVALAAIFIISSLIFVFSGTNLTGQNFFNLFLESLFYLAAYLLIAIAFSVLLHISVMLVNGDRRFFKTLEVVTYSSSIGLFYVVLEVINRVVDNYINSTPEYTTFIIFSVAALHLFYVVVEALHIFEDMPTSKAVLSIIALPGILAYAILILYFFTLF